MIRASAQAAGSPTAAPMRRKRPTSDSTEAAHGRRIGAQGHAHADFPPPLGDREGEHAVDSDRREKRREAAEGHGQHEDEPFGQQGLADLGRQRLDVEDRELRIEGRHRGPRGGREAIGRELAAQVERKRAQVRVLEIGREGERMVLLADAARLGVPDDADDLDVGRSIAPADAEALADRGSPGEELVRHRFVDDGDRPRPQIVLEPELAAGHQRDAERREVPRSDLIEPHPDALGLLVVGAGSAHVGRLVAPRHRGDLGGRNRPDAWRSAECLAQAAHEHRRPLRGVAIGVGSERECEDVVGLDSQVHAAEVREALREEAGGHEQHEGQGDLGRHEPAARADRLAPRGARAAALARQRARRVEPRGAVSRADAEEDPGDDRQEGREGDHARVDRDRDLPQIGVGRKRGEKRRQRPGRQGETEGAAGDREGQALDDGLAEQLPRIGADREADAVLALAGDAARGEQTREVRTGDQEHEADHPHQREQRRAEPLPHVGPADAPGRKLDPAREEFLLAGVVPVRHLRKEGLEERPIRRGE